MIKDMYERRKMLVDFSGAVMIPIPMKLVTNLCEECHILSLLKHTTKLLTAIIHSRIYSNYTITWEMTDMASEKSVEPRLMIEKMVTFKRSLLSNKALGC